MQVQLHPLVPFSRIFPLGKTWAGTHGIGLQNRLIFESVLNQLALNTVYTAYLNIFKDEFMRRKIPPLQALLCFESAARHASYTHASQELFLSQSAVSRQIQQLENKPSTYKDFTIIQSQDETPAYLKIQYYKEG